MADRRLEEIRTSDDAESRVNVELIEWLKTSGVNYLLVILIVVILFRGYLWWGERRERLRDQAWADLNSTDLPASLESLADRVKGTDSVAELALLRAAQAYHRDLLLDDTLDLVPETPALTNPESDVKPDDPRDRPTPRMTESERRETLDRMERLYRRVLETTAGSGKEINWKLGLALEAMFGLAAVAEMRGDFAGADEWFLRIESDAAGRYPKLAQVAAAWRADTDSRHPIDFLDQTIVNEAMREPVVQMGEAGRTGLQGATPAADSPTDAEPQDEPPSPQDQPAGDGASETDPAKKPETSDTPDKPDQPAEPPASGDGL